MTRVSRVHARVLASISCVAAVVLGAPCAFAAEHPVEAAAGPPTVAGAPLVDEVLAPEPPLPTGLPSASPPPVPLPVSLPVLTVSMPHLGQATRPSQAAQPRPPWRGDVAGRAGGQPAHAAPASSAPAPAAHGHGSRVAPSWLAGLDPGGLFVAGARAVPRIIAGLSHWFRNTLLSSFGYLALILLLMTSAFAFATSERANRLA